MHQPVDTTAPTDQDPATDEAPIDWHIFSVRDFMAVIAGCREANPRDPLRALEDALLDLVDQAEDGWTPAPNP